MPTFALPCVLILAFAACSAAPGASPGSSVEGPPVTGSPSGAGTAAAAAIIAAAKLGDDASLGALQGIRLTADGTAAAATVLASGPTGDALWAATYVYASAPGDPAPLLSVATAATASPSVRAMAGAGLVAVGRIEGLDALVAAVGVADAMDGAEPAAKVWEFAASVLERYTHAGFPAPVSGDDAERTGLAASWTGWLATNRGQLRFDAPSQLWVKA